MNFIFISLMFICVMAILVKVIAIVYFKFWLAPICHAWKPHSRDWKNWQEIKFMSNTKTRHILFLLWTLFQSNILEIRVRKDVSLHNLERNLGPIQTPGETFSWCLHYEFKILPFHLRRKKIKRKPSLMHILRPQFQFM